jgi:hypothetical protein
MDWGSVAAGKGPYQPTRIQFPHGSSFSVVGRAYENEDPFEDVEDQEELQSLVDHISPSASSVMMTGKTVSSLNLVPHKKTPNLFLKKIWMKKRDSLI